MAPFLLQAQAEFGVESAAGVAGKPIWATERFGMLGTDRTDRNVAEET